mgnify:CR=1 FL=1
MPSVFYKEYGGGYPLIFLHGFCETNFVWQGLAESLQDEYRVICPDLPGFGKSPILKEDFGIDEVASSIKVLLEELDIEKCIVFGHSLGGYVTLSLLRQFPELIDGFCLFNSSVYADSEEKKENRNKLIEHIQENGIKPFIRTFVPSLFYIERLDEFDFVIKQIREEGLKMDEKAVMGYAAAMRDREESIDILKKYSAKALIIAGEEDNNVPKAVSQKMAEMVGASRYYLLPASAHMSMFEQKARSAEIIKFFTNTILNQ